MRFVGTEAYKEGKGLWVVLMTDKGEAVTLFDRNPYAVGNAEPVGRQFILTCPPEWEPYSGSVTLVAQ